jgi:hypothetical protein
MSCSSEFRIGCWELRVGRSILVSLGVGRWALGVRPLLS